MPITLIDLDHRIIPNKLTLLGAVLAPAIVALTQPDAIPEHLIAGAAAGGFFLLVAFAYPRGMGMGDVKLAAVLGLFLGRDVVPALFIAFLVGTLVGAAIIALKGAARRPQDGRPLRPLPRPRRGRRPLRGRRDGRLVPHDLPLGPSPHRSPQGASGGCR